jgi:hypothetical protein
MSKRWQGLRSNLRRHSLPLNQTVKFHGRANILPVITTCRHLQRLVPEGLVKQPAHPSCRQNFSIRPPLIVFWHETRYKFLRAPFCNFCFFTGKMVPANAPRLACVPAAICSPDFSRLTRNKPRGRTGRSSRTAWREWRGKNNPTSHSSYTPSAN